MDCLSEDLSISDDATCFWFSTRWDEPPLAFYGFPLLLTASVWVSAIETEEVDLIMILFLFFCCRLRPLTSSAAAALLLTEPVPPFAWPCFFEFLAAPLWLLTALELTTFADERRETPLSFLPSTPPPTSELLDLHEPSVAMACCCLPSSRSPSFVGYLTLRFL